MINSVYIIGRLTKDTELQITENGNEYSNITLAVQRSYKNSDGIYEADFINVSMWNGAAKSLNEYSKKGDIVAVRGRLETYKDKENNNRLNVVAEKVSFLGKSNINKEKDDMEER